MNSITKMLFAALAVIAAGSMFVLGSGTANAQVAGGADILSIAKICLDTEGDEVTDETLTFDVAVTPDLDLDIDPVLGLGLLDLEDIAGDLGLPSDAFEGLDDAEILALINETLAFEIEVSCGATVDLLWDTETGDTDFTALVEFLEDLFIDFGDDIISADLVIEEILGGGVGDEGCLIDITDTALWTIFQETGLLCIITNDLTPATADLTVEKECPSGAGTGTFNIIVDGDSGVFGCGTSETFEDMPTGEPISISEIIGGSDTYVTSISCDDTAGSDAAGTTLEVTLEGDVEEVTCTVSNVLVDGGLTDDEIRDILEALNLDLEIEIEIENELNNINENINANDNDNTNNNVNENTQNQTNDQNTNVTTGDVNVSSGGGEGTGTGTGTGSGAGTVTIKAPNTGSAGLADMSNGSGLSTGVLAAAFGVVATLSLAAVRFVGARS